MPTGIGSGIAGEVFTDEIGSGSRGGSTICPTRYSVNLNGLSQIGQETGTLLDLGTNNFSYSFWFKTSETSVQGIFSTDFNNTGVGLDIFLSASGILTATFDSVTFPTTASLNDGEWYHAVLSVDRSGDWKWYIDGINTNTLANPVGTAIFVGNYLWGNSFSTSFFNGNLTELSIWGTALSSSEVLTIYNNMFGSQTCLTDLTFSSGNLIQNGSFNEIGPQLIDNPTFNAPTSPDLIVNGDFSAEGINLVDNPNFTDTGIELMANYDFASGLTSWTNGGVTESGGVVTFNNLSDYLYQNESFVPSSSYKIVIEGSGDVRYRTGYAGADATREPVTLPATVYFVATSDSNRFQVYGSDPSSTATVSSVSVKELGADWIEFINDPESVSFGENGLTIVQSSVGGTGNRAYQGSVTEADKSYKVTYTIFDSSYTSTNRVQYYNGGAYVDLPEQGEGTHTFYYTREGANNSWIFNLSTPTPSVTDFVTISSISVQELGEDWDDLGNPLDVASFNENGLTITSANGNGIGNRVSQSDVTEASTSYKVTYTIHSVSLTGSNTLRYFNGNSYIELPTAITGTPQTLYYTTASTITTAGWFFRLATNDGSTTDFATISSISVQEVDWAFEGGWSLGSNKALATSAVGGDTLSQAGVFTLDKSYKTTFLSTLDSGNCFAEFGSDGFIGQLPSGTASNLFYYQTNEVGDSARIAFEVQSPMTGSISNVLTYQMDPNGYWNIPTANSTQLVLNPMFTNTGPEEVTNGDFSQTALGTDLVTDGEFPSGTTAWTTQGTSTINVGSATVEGLGSLTSGGANWGVSQVYSGYDPQKSYKITFTAKQLTGTGNFLSGISWTNNFDQAITTDFVTYEYYASPVNAAYVSTVFGGITIGDTFEIKDVSVKEVLQLVTNGDFTDGVEQLTQPIDLTADFIANSGGVIVDADTFTTSGGGLDGIKSSYGLLTAGKSYKLVIAGSTTSSGFTIGDLSGNGNEYGTGFGTFYFVALSLGGVWVRQQTAGTTDLTTFTIEELGEDWTLVGVNATNTITFESGGARVNSVDANISLRQDALEVGKSYKLTCDITETTGALALDGSVGGSTIILDEGFNEVYFTALIDTLKIKRYSVVSNVLIDNISVQELGEGWTVKMSNLSPTTSLKYVEFVETGARFVSDITDAPYLYLEQYTLSSGKSYKFTCSVAYTGTGKIKAQVGGYETASLEEGLNTIYTGSISTNTVLRFLRNNANVDCIISNVSVEETGLDWVSPDAGTVNTFSATGLTMTSVNGGTNNNRIRQASVTADDQAYKVVYTIVGSSLTAGNYLQFSNGATYVNMKTTVGNHTLHFTRSGSDDSVYLRLVSNNGSLTDTVDIGSITIVEVQGWTLEDGKLVGDLPDLAKSATQDIGAIAGNSYKATMDVALAEEELITNGSFREVGADLVLDGDFPLPNDNWLIAASTTINGGSATFGGLGTVADMLAGAFALRVEADGGVVEAQSCLISDLTFLTENP